MSLPEFLSDAWDYRGRSAERATTGGWISAAMILGGEACERLTTLGIAVNLVTYLRATMRLGNATSANVVTNFLGSSFMLCLLGGFVADTYLGRSGSIRLTPSGWHRFSHNMTLAAFHLTASAAAPATCAPATDKQLSVLYLSLYTIALGTGGLKSSVSGFGSDQFDESNKMERTQMTAFFNWFFFFISIGSLLAVTVLVYVQDHLGRGWGYGICAVAIVVGLTVFLAGTRRYRYKKLVGSPLTQIASVFAGAWRKRRLELPADTSELKLKMRMTHLYMDACSFLDKAAIKESGMPTDKWHLSTLTDVEEVKMVLRMLPVWATTIMFWTVYAQMTTFSVSQATTMDRRLAPSFEIPPASLTAFFVVSILITVPFYDRLVVPISRCLIHNSHGLTPLQRIAVGLVLSILAMISAALGELRRLSSDGRPVSVFWLVPQFFFVGAGEAFTYIGQLDFFLRECPKGMKTMSTGLFLSTMSLGCFLSSVLVAAVHRLASGNKPWLANNLDHGRLYNFYWLLAILSGINFVVYLMCSKWYVYKDKRMAEEGIELEETDKTTKSTIRNTTLTSKISPLGSPISSVSWEPVWCKV
ncbi:hypothetical protein SAY86_000450 [Trapa natans]|uniref:Uncharacterized protein n=1 Tax=Trapa natans TaxID=22666 RepID=A0AAN7RFP7_TRANT|nr:hypothetical protein SAY86_000450 [Trapa natans]